MSSKKRTKNKRYQRDQKIKKRGSVVQTKRAPKNEKRWKKEVGYANRLLARKEYFRMKNSILSGPPLRSLQDVTCYLGPRSPV